MQNVNRICLAFPCNIPGYQATAKSKNRRSIFVWIQRSKFSTGDESLSSSSFMRAVTKLMKILAKLEIGGPYLRQRNFPSIRKLCEHVTSFLNVQNEQKQAKYPMSKNHMDILAHLIGKYTESAKSRPPLLCID